jgi:hypothetical protein
MDASPMSETARHLAALAGYGRAEGYLELRWRAPRGMRSEFIAITALDTAAARAHTLSVDHDVYVGAAPRARRAGTRAAVQASWVLWVECDRADSHLALNAFVPRPALAIASGSGGTHAYWPLASPLAPDALEHANRALAFALDADRQSTDAARILRPAGTLNHKRAPAQPVALRWFDEGAVFDAGQVLAEVPHPTVHVGARGTVERRDPAGDPLLAIPPTVYVPALVGRPLSRDRKVACPFHDDRTPSLHAFGPGHGWRCFGCGACGSIFDLAAHVWGLGTRGPDFCELRRRLATTFQLPDGPPRRRVNA